MPVTVTMGSMPFVTLKLTMQFQQGVVCVGLKTLGSDPINTELTCQ